ncbi:MAG: histidine ammonia-lyase [Candidatus Aminicenantes bacterium]|nr:histidine ammonia-lyase [Candidatus Aminicenantes bacterium]
MIKIDGNSLSIEDVSAVSRNDEQVELAAESVGKINRSRDFVEKILKENKTVYGINTGFGALANTFISKEDSTKLQENLIRSHAVCVGPPLAEDIVRGIMLLRANALTKGYSGVRKELIEFLVQLLNKKVYPYIPSQGSVGASGDLAPLAHLALVIMGEGECLEEGKRLPADEVLAKKGLKPLKLLAKEGLGLINGTQMMSAIGCLVVADAELLLKNAQVAGSMSLEALKGTARAFDEKIHALRPHPGQTRIAANIRKLIEDSEIIASHVNCERVQDAYTLRCMPQVLGPIADITGYARNVLTIEINSATDNPLVFPEEEEVISGGNFHGEPLAFIMDYLCIALAEIASISERTTDRLVNPHVSGLPPFLSSKSGLNSGFMITQYTAAALVSENKVLAHPSSVDSIPTSAGQEDHVSMGAIAARNAAAIVKNVQQVMAIEMLCAAQGIDFQELAPGAGTKAAHRVIREHVSHLEEDRVLYKDMEKVRELVVSGAIVDAVEEAVGAIE